MEEQIEIHLNSLQTAYVDVVGIGHPADRVMLARQISLCPLIFCTKYAGKQYEKGLPVVV